MTKTNEQVVRRISKDLDNKLKKIRKDMKCSYSDASTLLSLKLEQSEIKIKKLTRNRGIGL